MEKDNIVLKSVNGRRCLTKCYPRDIPSIHPILLTKVTSKTTDYCSVDPVFTKIPQNNSTIATSEKEYNMIFIDKCNLNDNNIYQQPNEIDSLLLTFYFNPRDFLINIYNLYSFDSVVAWTISNSYLPFNTLLRINNCAWLAYGNKVDAMTDIVLKYYYDIAKNHWLLDYVKIIKNKYSFDFSSFKKYTENDNIYNIILDNFFDYNFFTSSIKKYIYENQKNWNDIEGHYIQIKKYIFKTVLKNIEEKIKI